MVLRGVRNGFLNFGPFGTVFDESRAVWNLVRFKVMQPQFCSENIENIVLNFRTHIQILTGAHAMF